MLRRPGFVGCRVAPLLALPLRKARGVKRRKALVRNAAPRGPSCDQGRSLQRKGSPANDARRRASRRSTAAFAEATMRRLISSGPRFLTRHLRRESSKAPCGRVVVPNGRSPGTARVRKDSDALRPRGPHRPGAAEIAIRFAGTKGKVLCRISGPSPRFVPPWLASRRRPSADEVEEYRHMIGIKSTMDFKLHIVICCTQAERFAVGRPIAARLWRAARLKVTNRCDSYS